MTWAIDLLAPVFIYEELVTSFYEYGGALQAIFVTTAVISFLSMESKISKISKGRAKAVLMFTVLYSLYIQLADIMFHEYFFGFYLMQATVGVGFTVWLMCKDYELCESQP